MPLSPFARESLAEVLTALEKTAEKFESVVYHEGLESVIPATVAEDLRNAIEGLESALSGVANAEADWLAAKTRYEAAQAASRFGFIREGAFADEGLRYRNAKAEAEKAGLLTD